MRAGEQTSYPSGPGRLPASRAVTRRPRAQTLGADLAERLAVLRRAVPEDRGQGAGRWERARCEERRAAGPWLPSAGGRGRPGFKVGVPGGAALDRRGLTGEGFPTDGEVSGMRLLVVWGQGGC